MNGIEPWLAEDWQRGLFLGRIDAGEGPTPVLIRNGQVENLCRIAPTTAQLLERCTDNAAIPSGAALGPLLGLDLRAAWMPERRTAKVTLLAPPDLQCIKAAGVTFAASTLERVIEERARGDATQAQALRNALGARIGGDLKAVQPGSDAADKLKQALVAEGLWSQYLEVAIGPDAEIFTKAPVLASVGWGDYIGVRADSQWNNPEPEIVLFCDAAGQPRGASLGNDVNLRDFEGRSALLLGKAKDNNASCAMGPFVRLFDRHFTLADVCEAQIRLEVTGRDGFILHGESSMRLISRHPLDLAHQTASQHHQYPDGFALFLGTMFAPVKDRGAAGQGFTHQVGDRVRVSTARLGTLENEVAHCDVAPPWNFGVGALMLNLARRGLLA